jgi:hypothetical protein
MTEIPLGTSTIRLRVGFGFVSDGLVGITILSLVVVLCYSTHGGVLENLNKSNGYSRRPNFARPNK